MLDILKVEETLLKSVGKYAINRITGVRRRIERIEVGATTFIIYLEREGKVNLITFIACYEIERC